MELASKATTGEPAGGGEAWRQGLGVEGGREGERGRVAFCTFVRLSAPLTRRCREIKNSWSDNWGEGGYFKVLRDNHGCGTASDVVYAVTAAGSGRGSV